MEMATTKSGGLLSTNQNSVEAILCRILLGEAVSWSSLASEASPELVLEKCRHHGVEALVFHSMNGSQAWNSWPDEVTSRLELGSKAGIAQDMLRSHHLNVLLQEFQRQGIPCLITKGEALAISHYPIPGTRHRGDSDLFISLRDIEAALEAVSNVGFAVVSSIYKTHQFSVRPSGESLSGVQFDIHWRISNHPRFARTISFDSGFESGAEIKQLANARMLSPVNSLLLACMHRAGNCNHDPNRLIWIYDIQLLIESLAESQWHDFVCAAVQLKVQGECLDGLRMAEKYFDASIPDWVSRRLKLAEQSGSRKDRYEQSYLALLIDDWKHLSGWKSRVGLFRELAFT